MATSKNLDITDISDDLDLDSDDLDFTALMGADYALYSHSVIMGRSIPSEIDGLKPVQRRILFQMYRDKLFPGRAPMKSQTITSNVMGHLHPHSDCYDSMVNMANKTIRLPSVDGQGSFGKHYGSSAASARYTEARLSDYGNLMVDELSSHCVDYKPNYNGSIQEPVVLPVQYPNLIVNGSWGMAVGFATKIPQHNPEESIEAAIHRVRYPNCTVDKIMKIMPGPDFITGGVVRADDKGIRDYYATGRGSFAIRGRWHIDGRNIVITELPYGVSAEQFRTTILKGIQEGKIVGVSDINTLTDRVRGLLIEISVKRGVAPQSVVGDLLNHSPLESRFSANITALDEGYHPKTRSILDLLDAFIAHRRRVVKAHSQSALDAARKRKPLIDGLIIVIADLDTTLKIIRSAKTPTIAAKGLRDHFGITGEQAQHVLGMQLRSLTNQDSLALIAEGKKLDDEIARLETIISDPDVLDKTMIEGLRAVKKAVASERLTDLVDRWEDAPEKVDRATSGAASSTGWCLSDEGVFSGAGHAFGETDRAVMLFDDGRIKVTDGKGLPKSIVNTPAAPNLDGLLSCKVMGENQSIIVVTASGKALHLSHDEVRPQGISGNGVSGIKLSPDDEALGLMVVSDSDKVLTVSDEGYKVTEVSDIPTKGRGGSGVVIHKLRKAENGVSEIYSGAGFVVNGKLAPPTPRSRAANPVKMTSFAIS